MRAAILSMALTGIAAPAAVRIETAPTGNSPASTLIFADSELLLLDDDERTYYRITPAALEELSGAMPPALAGLRNSPFDTMSRVEGLPVRTRTYVNGSVLREIVLSSVETRDIAKSHFEVPAGYTEQSLMPQGGPL
jgi:hypothetical protein